jgi:hypothetical protein
VPLIDRLCLDTPARLAGRIDDSFNTAQQAQREDNSNPARVQLPVEVFSIILDHVEDLDRRYWGQPRIINSTLLSLALCNKTLHSVVQPRLFSEASLHRFEQLIRFVYALELQPRGSREARAVNELCMHWSSPYPFHDSYHNFQLSHRRLNNMALALSPALKTLKLSWKNATMQQSDVDALDGYLALTTSLENFTLEIDSLRHDMRFGAEGVEIMETDDYELMIRKGTTDKMRSLHSFLCSTTRATARQWPPDECGTS